MAASPAQALRLLYLTARDPDSGDDIISPTSRIAIGTLSRDFRVSLAVVGDVNTVGMNRLRVDLGPVRVAGGLESSGADARAKSGLRQLMRERHGTATFNARLQSAIQRKADDFDAIVIDDLIAWSYRPATEGVPIVYLAREVCSADEAPKQGIFSRFRGNSLRDYERALFDEVDHIFARPEIAHQIGDHDPDGTAEQLHDDIGPEIGPWPVLQHDVGEGDRRVEMGARGRSERNDDGVEHAGGRCCIGEQL